MSAIEIMNDEETSRFARGEDSGFGALSTERGNLPLRAMDVKAKITGLVAEVVLEQVFENVLSEPIEATYVFPLPDRAGVTRFVLEVNGRVVEGEIKERGQARRDYTAAIQAGHRAAITEEERPGVFTMRVGNLMPRERAKVRLSMTGPLPYDEGEATFRFPLVVAPRYIPGRALEGGNVGDGVATDTDAVPDASRITPPVLLPGCPSPVQLALAVEVDPGLLPMSRLRSSLHAVVEPTAQGRVRRVELRPGERVNRDFVLRFELGADAVQTALALVPDASGEKSEGTFLMTLVPPPSLARTERPRDIVFVLDRSGSMEGWKMVAARRAVARMVDTLRDKDTFQVFAFDDSIETPKHLPGEGLVPATDRNRFRAVEFLAALESRGGTEMAEPLERGAQLLGGGYGDRDRVLVLVTDGQVGNEDQILKRLSSRVRGLRIFTLGVDRAVNEGFLRRLAALGGGMSEVVESEDRLDEVMDKIHRRIATPLLTELAIVPRGLDVVADSIVPSRIPDLFAGAPVVITGRYRGASAGELMVTAQDGLGRTWSETLRGEATSGRAITTIWARGQVRDLEDRFAVGRGDRRDLERRIIDTSLRFGVLSRFTAFLAVDKSEKVNPGGETHKVMQPVEAPEGWLHERRGQASPAGAPNASAAMFSVGGARMRIAAPASMPIQASASFEADALAMDDEAEEASAPRSVMPDLARRAQSAPPPPASPARPAPSMSPKASMPPPSKAKKVAAPGGLKGALSSLF
ncbi:VWA domain-containing protein, partial [Myxococcota bacterium]|nr:VWA domain-containing protein [Myxococcota bacterium]